MNPLSYLKGCMAAVGRIPNWERFFDFSPKALRLSFLAQFLILPAFYITAFSITKGRSEALATPIDPVNISAIIILGLVYLLSFSAAAYIMTMIFEKQDRLRPWVIVRHWCVFFLAWVSAIGFGLYGAGILPFMAANGIFFAAFMGLLFVDIRLAKRIAGFEWNGAILAGCIVSVMGLSLVLTGLSYLI